MTTTAATTATTAATAATKNTITSALYPLVSVIKNSEIILGKDRVWMTTDVLSKQKQQKNFLELYNLTYSDLPRLPELTSKVSYDSEELNKFLEERGFDIRFAPIDDGFGVASAMKIAVQWLAEGNKFTEIISGKSYYTCYVEQGVRLYRDGDSKIVVILDTQSQDKVYLQICDPPEHLHEAGCALVSKKLYNCYEYTGVLFPQIEVDHQPDVSWLTDMYTYDRDLQRANISQAKQQTKFRMDEKGAIVESAAAIEVTFEAHDVKTPYIINSPFLVVVKRPGLKMPVFTGYMCEDSWVQAKRNK